MSRPSNQDQLNKEPHLEAGTEAAVAAALAKYPQAKALEAKAVADGTEVKLGWSDEASQAHIVELKVDAAGNVGGGEERPNVPPGLAKGENEKPHGKSGEPHGKSGEEHGMGRKK